MHLLLLLCDNAQRKGTMEFLYISYTQFCKCSFRRISEFAHNFWGRGPELNIFCTLSVLGRKERKSLLVRAFDVYCTVNVIARFKIIKCAKALCLALKGRLFRRKVSSILCLFCTLRLPKVKPKVLQMYRNRHQLVMFGDQLSIDPFCARALTR